jgi:hypothetical protein
MRKYIIALALILTMVSALVLSASPALAWGPITHAYQGVENVKISPSSIEAFSPANKQAYLLGSVYPDLALSAQLADGNTKQTMLHSETYYNALVTTATNSIQRSFIAGWRLHIDADKIEGEYGTYKRSVGVTLAPEFCVDKLVTKPDKIVEAMTLPSTLSYLILTGWNAAYPSYVPKLTQTNLNGAAGYFNMYWNWGAAIGWDYNTSVKNFSDWKPWVSQSITGINAGPTPPPVVIKHYCSICNTEINKTFSKSHLIYGVPSLEITITFGGGTTQDKICYPCLRAKVLQALDWNQANLGISLN